MPKSKKSRPTLARHIPRDDPPYAHLVRSNNQPLDSEVDEIRLIIQDAKKSLAEQANGFRPEAREESKALRALIKTCTKIIHPVRRLPFEIISEIFLQTLSGPHDWDDYPEVHDYDRGPWAYSKVCRRWRDVALQSPRLWSELSVPSNCGSYWLHVENPIGRLKLWLHRSRSAPLRILYGGLGKHGPKEHDTITSLLFEQSERWEVFRWIGCSDPGRFQRLGEVVGRVPLLRHLDVQHFIAGCSQEATTAVPFASLVALQPHLVRFHAERFLVDPFKLLDIAPNLEDLALVLNPAHDDIPRKWFPLSRLTHSGIQRLVINEPYMVALPYLVFPQLKCLGLRSFALDDLHLIAELISRSRCTLKKLVVQGKYRFQLSLDVVLQANPILEELTLVGDESMPHLPALKAFSCDVTGVDPNALVTMLESRCERGHLRKVTLWSAQTPVKKWVNVKLLRRVKDLGKKGVQVVVADIPWSYYSLKMQDSME
ncbi:hypothetical protein IW261DRAFT_1478505 [Armillaria novae-zelandiae]|uniref:F-box domain-containing protein n=1 Tax=Armillaria novae-zelandiae TaxID=153914 RepID=A0AA39TCB8_9AGAR|nr:hypothetical protein IW261DRAFT_1478505 [Armillaria novae-zelandiae]